MPENFDHVITRLEILISILDQLLQDDQCKFLWTGNFATPTSCSRPIVGINGHEHSTRPGRSKIQLNLDQVELLCSAEYAWDEVANALMVSKSTIWRHL